MNKKELINIAESSIGVIVKTNNNKYYLVCYNNLLLGYDGYMRFDDYNDDLTIYDNDNEWDIVKVYKVNQGFGLGTKHLINLLTDYSYLLKNSNLIWSNNDNKKVELTLKEIANKFGIDVNKLRIKE